MIVKVTDRGFGAERASYPSMSTKTIIFKILDLNIRMMVRKRDYISDTFRINLDGS